MLVRVRASWFRVIGEEKKGKLKVLWWGKTWPLVKGGGVIMILCLLPHCWRERWRVRRWRSLLWGLDMQLSPRKGRITFWLRQIVSECPGTLHHPFLYLRYCSTFLLRIIFCSACFNWNLALLFTLGVWQHRFWTVMNVHLAGSTSSYEMITHFFWFTDLWWA